MSISAASVLELRGAVLALKATDRTIRSQISKETRRLLTPIWQDAIDYRLAGIPDVDRKVLGGGVRVKAGNPAQLVAAGSTRPLSGGLLPTRDYAGFEFGVTDRNAYRTYTRRSPKGGTHTVRRRTTRQLPNRKPTGHVVWPAVSEALPRITSLWVQIIVREIYEALEGGKK